MPNADYGGDDMRKISWVLGIVFLTIGCASTDAVYNNYDRLVNVKDGVNEQEAKIIAQRMIVNTMEKRDYRITAPDIRTTPEALQYPDFWFVVFGHNWLSPMSTDPMAKTYTQLRETQYVVVISKKDGTLKFYGQWYPKREADFDWVFDMNAYKRKDPLALPPYEKSDKLF